MARLFISAGRAQTPAESGDSNSTKNRDRMGLEGNEVVRQASNDQNKEIL